MNVHLCIANGEVSGDPPPKDLRVSSPEQKNADPAEYSVAEYVLQLNGAVTRSACRCASESLPEVL